MEIIYVQKFRFSYIFTTSVFWISTFEVLFWHQLNIQYVFELNATWSDLVKYHNNIITAILHTLISYHKWYRWTTINQELDISCYRQTPYYTKSLLQEIFCNLSFRYELCTQCCYLDKSTGTVAGHVLKSRPVRLKFYLSTYKTTSNIWDWISCWCFLTLLWFY